MFDGWILDGWMDVEWMDGWMDGWMDVEWMDVGWLEKSELNQLSPVQLELG